MQARASGPMDRLSTALFTILVLQLAVGAFLRQPLVALALVAATQAVAAAVYLARWSNARWRPQRTQPFRLHLPVVALLILPSTVLSDDPVRSGLVALAIAVVFLAYFAFLDAFLASARGGCSPWGFARLAAGGGASIVLARLGGRLTAATYLPWYNLAPEAGLPVRPFDHLFDLLLVAAFPVVAVTLVAGPARRGTRLRQGVQAVCLALIAIGIVLSFSRAAWIAFGVELLALTALWLPRRKAPIVLGGLAALGAAALCIPGVASRVLSLFSLGHSTNIQRLDQWAVALERIGASPFAGHGLGSFGALYLEARPGVSTGYWCPHNLYLHIAVECGIPALFVLLAWIADFLRQAPATRDAALAGAGDGRSVVRFGGIVAVCGLLCYGLFDL